MGTTDRGWPGATGAIAGVFLSLMGLTLLAPTPSPLLLVSALGLGLVAGAVLGELAGSRQLRGKAAATLYWGLYGAAVGAFPGVFLVLAFRGSHRLMMPVFLGSVLLGGCVGAALGRVRHGGRLTVGELMGWVATIGRGLGLVVSLA